MPSRQGSAFRKPEPTCGIHVQGIRRLATAAAQRHLRAHGHLRVRRRQQAPILKFHHSDSQSSIIPTCQQQTPLCIRMRQELQFVTGQRRTCCSLPRRQPWRKRKFHGSFRGAERPEDEGWSRTPWRDHQATRSRFLRTISAGIADGCRSWELRSRQGLPGEALSEAWLGRSVQCEGRGGKQAGLRQAGQSHRTEENAVRPRCLHLRCTLPPGSPWCL